MKKAIRYSLFSFVLSLLLIAANSLAGPLIDPDFTHTGIVWLVISFNVSTVVTLIVFFAGRKKVKKDHGFFSLVSISLKFLMELLIALGWFLVAKKTSLPFVVLFFVLYLTFTIFSIFVILNTLKNNSL